jgi:quinol monooxygenase YgiN
MPRIAILAQMRAQPGKRQALMDALAPLHDAVKAEPGTEVFIMHASDADPDIVMFYEVYRDKDALSAHQQNPALKSIGPAMAGLVAGAPEITRFTPARAKGLEIS